ncbi:MAG: C_GCAxxG_C_C family protein [Deltaproteobacteria bacterium]|nr:C_GCAxxG_C_C family protein [Deltaproteobacteria bacterium]
MIDSDSALESSIATGFGGGLGRNGFICGVIAAGTMIIGLRCKGKDKKEVYQIVDSFLNDFKSQFGVVNCRELIGVDLKTKEGMTYLKTEGHKKCSEFVRYAANKISEIVQKIQDAGEKNRTQDAGSIEFRD